MKRSKIIYHPKICLFAILVIGLIAFKKQQRIISKNSENYPLKETYTLIREIFLSVPRRGHD